MTESVPLTTQANGSAEDAVRPPARSRRPEQEVFDEIAELTATPGYAHVIAFLCVRDNFVWHRRDGMKAEDMQHLYSRSRLIRTEMSTLIGLMVRAGGDLAAPAPADVDALVKRTDALMEELHRCMGAPTLDGMFAAFEAGETPPNPWESGGAMREPIFYGGEGAFSFQNCDFAIEKYAADDPWLKEHRKAGIADMVAFAKAAADIQNSKVSAAMTAGANTPGDPRLLEAFTLTAAEIAPVAGLGEDTASACIDAFTLPVGRGNPTFATISDFNTVNGSPVLETGDGRHLLFHFNALAEAVYESPFYWMFEDKPYRPALSDHRGDFTEAFAVDRLSRVFGPARVHRGVNIDRAKGDRIGEIDVLVLFADRAIVLQAKSKRLTLAARKGNDLQLRGDFKGAVQDAYDQAMDCSAALSDRSLRFSTADGTTIKIPPEISQVFPVCLVSDHYPALAFQTDQFLVRREEPKVLAPLVIDVFTLDVMAEMLERPIRFLSYLELRAIHGPKVLIHHEITLLSYHLKYNLWLEKEHDMVVFEDDFAADIEIAMGVRRMGQPGARTPRGVLTVIAGSRLDRLIRAIEANPTGTLTDTVMLAYQLAENGITELRDNLEKVVATAGWRGESNFVLGFGGSGIAIHCNADTDANSLARIDDHMRARKYRSRADSWYGIVIAPGGTLRFGHKVVFPWKHDSRAERAADRLIKRPVATLAALRPALVGRNDPCHCGSGLKYKKCHLNLDQSG